MARVVVLSFKDNDAAEAFCQHTLDAQADVYEGIPLSIAATVVAHAEIEAMVARPTAFCKCTIVGKSGRTNAARGKFSALTERWGRTERFGWFVHRRCNKVNFFVWRDFIKNMLIASGNDLLPELKEKMNEEVVEPERPVESLALGEVQMREAEPVGSRDDVPAETREVGLPEPGPGYWEVGDY